MTTSRNLQCGAALLEEKDGEGAAQFGITEASHSRINFEDNYPDINQFKVEFAFRTTTPNGMIWIWASYKSYTRYFFLNLVNGLLQLEIITLTLQAKGHKAPKILVYKSEKLNNGKWRNVRIQKQDREILIKVGAYPAQSMKDAPSAKVMRKRMYVGGVISRHRKQFNLTVPAFSGCIRDFTVDDIPRDLFASQRDVIPCAVASKSVYVHEGGYMTFGKSDFMFFFCKTMVL
ncbi:unnamed protein product [Gongylonema pulchrum]|uniref:LAM_G_DOMAIN domain-containing protein n=1 Tax=Gongylonema pulchrum TaxID=637853 RepID=A0A183CWR2_9BILA|nr:unnamed protein product [Gongylonema pulchrum]